jgi:uncharacterized protein (DUF1800 family)
MSTSRRDLFKLGAMAAAAAAVLSPSEAAAQRIVRPYSTRPKSPPASGDSLLRLVRRATNGVTEEEMTRARALGFRRYLDYQLNYTAIDDRAVEDFVTRNYPSLSQTGEQLYQQDQNLLFNQLYDATIYRSAFSRRQLYEKMVEFWTDHFNIYYPKVQYLKILDEREVIRKHALGNFQEMLRASAHSPAMLEYLDNTRSRARSVNENYAREIMELHTLGVDGGYTQTDVAELTRVLTGWTIQGRGQFRFDPNGHDFGAKTVMGMNFPAQATSVGAAAQQEGEAAINMLVNHENTARFIATKMTQWLLQYDPPKELVTKVAETYMRTKGDIKSMIRDILTPANLLAAPAKYKQPRQMVSSALRATQPVVTNIGTLRGQLGVLGQPLFQWETPDGWPDSTDWWAGLILQRWNFASFLTNLATGNIVVDVNPLLSASTPAGITDVISKRAFGGEMPADLKQDLTAYLSAAPITATRVREAFALALSSPAFQWF